MGVTRKENCNAAIGKAITQINDNCVENEKYLPLVSISLLFSSSSGFNLDGHDDYDEEDEDAVKHKITSIEEWEGLCRLDHHGKPLRIHLLFPRLKNPGSFQFSGKSAFRFPFTPLLLDYDRQNMAFFVIFDSKSDDRSTLRFGCLDAIELKKKTNDLKYQADLQCSKDIWANFGRKAEAQFSYFIKGGLADESLTISTDTIVVCKGSRSLANSLVTSISEDDLTSMILAKKSTSIPFSKQYGDEVNTVTNGWQLAQWWWSGGRESIPGVKVLRLSSIEVPIAVLEDGSVVVSGTHIRLGESASFEEEILNRKLLRLIVPKEEEPTKYLKPRNLYSYLEELEAISR